ncbi:MAG: hypothetical protein LBD94_02685 [Rickettsiales bacterium]|nr:hypothetical protein [Rickettsiales bacterium]
MIIKKRGVDMLYMNIQRISIAEANENNSISEILDFLKEYPRAEIGVGVSKQKGEFKTPRNEFVKELKNRYLEEVGNICRQHHIYRDNWDERHKYIGTLGLHVNGGCEKKGWPCMMMRGCMPDALRDMMEFCGFDSMQVNFTEGFCLFDLDKDEIAGNFRRNSRKYDVLDDRRLILPYNRVTKPWVQKFRYDSRKDEWRQYRNENDFSPWAEIRGRVILNILYEESFGGNSVAEYERPVFHGICQGYTCGFAPENIVDELDKIEEVQTEKVPVYLDAESDASGERCLNLSKAAQLCDDIRKWQLDRAKQK